MQFYFNKPAENWEEVLPIGNGKIGGMIFGGIQKEIIGLNEESIWSGYQRDRMNSQSFEGLEESRQLILEGKFEQAEKVIEERMVGDYGEAYLPLGNLEIEFNNHLAEKVDHYKRLLDLEKSIGNISYEIQGCSYKREYFVSYPNQAMFIKLTSEKKNLNIKVNFISELFFKTRIAGNQLYFNGQCPEHVDPENLQTEQPVIQGEKGMEFKGRIICEFTDGDLEYDEQKLCVINAKEIILKIELMTYQESELPFNFETVKEKHILDYQRIFSKVLLDLGEGVEKPINERLLDLKMGIIDPSLFALYFQYGRYLLISSSRENSLPANLQGIWNWNLRPMWRSNYTTNINLQMNYWAADSCNLSECLSPYIEFIKKISQAGEKTAQEMYHCAGSVQHHNMDKWLNTSPVGRIPGERVGRSGSTVWSMWPMGGVWLGNDLFRHYEYTLDETYLKEAVYPVLEKNIIFLNDWLYEYHGQFITCPSTSPENRYRLENGCAVAVSYSTTMDITLIKECVSFFDRCCEILDIESIALKQIKQKMKNFSTYKIGSLGQLLEWHSEYQENEPGHRHVSHLYGLYPSEMFAGEETLVTAAKKSLEIRIENGGGYTGWSNSWITNLYAILGEPDNVFKFLKNSLVKSTYDNLWDAHPPFQIDGNFGDIAAIANMLVQDRNGEIKLLPALPKEFRNGYVKGLKIKGNKEIEMKWKNGEVVFYREIPNRIHI